MGDWLNKLNLVNFKHVFGLRIGTKKHIVILIDFEQFQILLPKTVCLPNFKLIKDKQRFAIPSPFNFISTCFGQYDQTYSCLQHDFNLDVFSSW